MPEVFLYNPFRLDLYFEQGKILKILYFELIFFNVFKNVFNVKILEFKSLFLFKIIYWILFKKDSSDRQDKYLSMSCWVKIEIKRKVLEMSFKSVAQAATIVIKLWL